MVLRAAGAPHQPWHRRPIRPPTIRPRGHVTLTRHRAQQAAQRNAPWSGSFGAHRGPSAPSTPPLWTGRDRCVRGFPPAMTRAHPLRGPHRYPVRNHPETPPLPQPRRRRHRYPTRPLIHRHDLHTPTHASLGTPAHGVNGHLPSTERRRRRQSPAPGDSATSVQTEIPKCCRQALRPAPSVTHIRH